MAYRSLYSTDESSAPTSSKKKKYKSLYEDGSPPQPQAVAAQVVQAKQQKTATPAPKVATKPAAHKPGLLDRVEGVARGVADFAGNIVAAPVEAINQKVVKPYISSPAGAVGSALADATKGKGFDYRKQYQEQQAEVSPLKQGAKLVDKKLGTNIQSGVDYANKKPGEVLTTAGLVIADIGTGGALTPVIAPTLTGYYGTKYAKDLPNNIKAINKEKDPAKKFELGTEVVLGGLLLGKGAKDTVTGIKNLPKTKEVDVGGTVPNQQARDFFNSVNPHLTPETSALLTKALDDNKTQFISELRGGKDITVENIQTVPTIYGKLIGIIKDKVGKNEKLTPAEQGVADQVANNPGQFVKTTDVVPYNAEAAAANAAPAAGGVTTETLPQTGDAIVKELQNPNVAEAPSAVPAPVDSAPAVPDVPTGGDAIVKELQSQSGPDIPGAPAEQPLPQNGDAIVKELQTPAAPSTDVPGVSPPLPTSGEAIVKELQATPRPKGSMKPLGENKQLTIPTEHLLPLKQEGGKRTDEEVATLEQDIQTNGIKEPLELLQAADGTLSINDGNHRLSAAEKFNIKDVPVRIVKEGGGEVTGKAAQEALANLGSGTTKGHLKPLGEKEKLKTTTKSTVGTPKLAQGVRRKAIKEKLIYGFDKTFNNLPEYDKVDVKEQGEKATELVLNDPEKAFNIAMGHEAPPSGILPESVFIAVENYAIDNKDVDMLRKLATGSSLTQEATGMGQRIRMLAERDEDSPVGAIKSVADARRVAAKKKAGKKGKTVEKQVSEMVKEIKKSIKTPTKTDWAMFVESIKC